MTAIARTLARRLIASTAGEERLDKLRAWKGRTQRRHAAKASPFDPWYRRNARALRRSKDQHRNERCFIIGNGPSLRRTDLGALREEATFGLNRIYLMFDELGWETTYHVTVNRLVIDQCAAEIGALRSQKFLPWDKREILGERADVRYLYSEPDGPMFIGDVQWKGVHEGATVTYVAMQLAYYMGFSEVYLVGVDHNFESKGPAHKVVTSAGDDPNHFHPNYFGAGFKWQLPDLVASEVSYTLARDAFARRGGRIVDATVGGKLDIFPKVDYGELTSSLRKTGVTQRR